MTASVTRIARPADSRTPTLSQTSSATPASPTTRPAARTGVIRSCSHTAATRAAKIGADDCSTASIPAEIDSAAQPRPANGSAVNARPNTAISRQRNRIVANPPRHSVSGTSTSRLASAMRRKIIGIAPKAGADERMKR